VMEEVRTNASKANKIISQALSGKVTLESLTSNPAASSSSPSPGGRKGRSKSAAAKSGGGGKTVSADSLGLGQRNSKSAGGGEADEEGAELRYSLSQQSPPKPYKSPYEPGDGPPTN
jgi:hypothetical protein